MLKKIIWEITSWVEGIIVALPSSIMGNKLRNIYWAKKFNVPRNDIIIFPGVHFFAHESITVGYGVQINYNALIDASSGSITIGNNVLIGPNCVLRAANHVFTDTTKPIKAQGYSGGPITIGDDCWLGSNVVVLKNVTIGKGSIIGAGAVVNRDIPPFSIAVGVPARVVGSREKKINSSLQPENQTKIKANITK